MTNGQITQLQDLSKCYMSPKDNRRDYWITRGVALNEISEKLNKWEKAQIRRLTHQYRHQIAAIRKNQT